jgi:hypothetical protein
MGGSEEFRDELDTEEFGPEESVKGLEIGGDELDEEELGGSKELRREELDEEELEEEEFDEGEEPIPCINESIVLSIIFPLPTLFKRLFISVSMFVGLETLSDCEYTKFNNCSLLLIGTNKIKPYNAKKLNFI